MVQAEKVSLKANISCLLHNGPWKLFALNIVWFFRRICNSGKCSYLLFYLCSTEHQHGSDRCHHYNTGANCNQPSGSIPCKAYKQEKPDDRGSMVHAGGLLIIFFGGTNVPVLIGGAVVAAAGYGLKGSMHFAMQPDPVDYGEWKSGVNTAGTLSAVNGFIGKVGMAIASSIGAALLQFGGFDAVLSVQSATAQSYITTMYIWVPIVMNIATIITMMFYNLDKNLPPQIIKELDERRAA